MKSSWHSVPHRTAILVTLGGLIAGSAAAQTTPQGSSNEQTPVPASGPAPSETPDTEGTDQRAAPPPSEGQPQALDGASPHGTMGPNLVDRIETSDAVSPGAIEVTTVDTKSKPVAGIQIELVRDRQSVAEGNSTSVQRATTDSAGNAKFTGVPIGSDSQYRVVIDSEGTRYGTRPFPLESRAGTRVLFHVFPLVTGIKQSLVAGRSFVFVEPRDDVLSIEYMQQFVNVGQNVLSARELKLKLPPGWKAFASNPMDPDLSVTKTADGVSLLGAIAPGQHTVVFTFQIPTSNESRVDFDLELWQNTAETQVATLVRPGLELAVEGFPDAAASENNGRQPFLVTGRSFLDAKSPPPRSVRVQVSGLPVIGSGRWVAALTAAFFVFAGLLIGLRRRRFAAGGVPIVDEQSRAAARERLLDELVALERAQRLGTVGQQTASDARETLIAAFVRVERQAVSS